MTTRTLTRATTFTAVGSGIFPLDMLRYDSCYPVDTETANAIYASIDQDTRYGEMRRFRLRGDNMRFGPTDARWASFGFKIEDIEEDR